MKLLCSSPDITKLDLLCARQVGYTLRSNSALAGLAFPSNALPTAVSGISFSNQFFATGGVPAYDWEVVAGNLPAGLTLDSFTGVLTGTPTTNGTFNFSIRLRDYHEASAGLTQAVTLAIAPAQPAQLALSLMGQGSNTEAWVTLNGPAGQRQAIQTSSNLLNWTSVTTNFTGTNFFQFIETNALRDPHRFYRSMVVP